MFLKGVVTVILFVGALVAADPNATDLFSVRSFRDPTTKAKIPVTPQLFAGDPPKIFMPEARAKTEQCAIPLLEMKIGKTGDSMALPVGPNKVDSASVVPPPMPACKRWNK